jgi:hypothetical protein
MARKRTKSGRFAKSRRRSVKRRSYKVRARRNPARRYARSTRKGQVRKTARRAYAPKRRARRNPKGIMSSPAVRYGIATAAGFAAASFADTADILNPTKEDGTAALPWGLKGSVLAGVITLVIAQYGLKGSNKQYARAAAVGMFSPSVISMIQGAMTPATTGGAYHNLPAKRRVARLSASSNSAQNFARASHALDNCA